MIGEVRDGFCSYFFVFGGRLVLVVVVLLMFCMVWEVVIC